MSQPPPFYLDHIAILVPSIEQVQARLAKLDAPFGPIESFPGEGTREMYIGPGDATARLLLMEAVDATGPYGKALQRRGPGLHHIAINVAGLSDYIDSLAGSGWYLLPQSLKTIHNGKTAWLCRPGVKGLIEVHERPYRAAAPFVSLLELPIPSGEERLLSRLPPKGHSLAGVHASNSEIGAITFCGQRVEFGELV